MPARATFRQMRGRVARRAVEGGEGHADSDGQRHRDDLCDVESGVAESLARHRRGWRSVARTTGRWRAATVQASLEPHGRPSPNSRRLRRRVEQQTAMALLRRTGTVGSDLGDGETGLVTQARDRVCRPTVRVVRTCRRCSARRTWGSTVGVIASRLVAHSCGRGISERAVLFIASGSSLPSIVTALRGRRCLICPVRVLIEG